MHGQKSVKRSINIVYFVVVVMLVIMIGIPVSFIQGQTNPTKVITQFMEESPICDKKVMEGTSVEAVHLPKTILAQVLCPEMISNPSIVPIEQRGSSQDASTPPITNAQHSPIQDRASSKEEAIPVQWVCTTSYDPTLPGVYTFVAQCAGYTYQGLMPYATIRVQKKKQKAQVQAFTPAPTNEQTYGTEEQSASIHPTLDQDDAYLSTFSLTKRLDGTPGFDTSSNPNDEYYKNGVGNDASASNGIVRSFDTITYDLQYQTQVYQNTSYEQGKLCFAFILPLSDEQAKWDTNAMSWMDPGYTITNKTYTYDFNGDGIMETKLCQVLQGTRTLIKPANNPTAIPGSGSLQVVVDVLAMANNSKVQPVFRAWMDHNKTGNQSLTSQMGEGDDACAKHHRVEAKTIQPSVVKVSAAPRYNVQIKQGIKDYTSVNDRYDFNSGNNKALDKGKGEQIGAMSAYGITLQLYNHKNRNMKGIEYPQGPITFHLKLSTQFMPSDKELTAQQQKEVAENYQPLVWSYDGQKTGGQQQDGRGLQDNKDYAVSAAPSNAGGTTTTTSKCYNGGDWSAKRKGDTLSVTVQNYQFKYPIFPNTDLGDASSMNTYYHYEKGVQNVGCFSAGEFFIFTPFYHDNTYILDDVHAKGGQFKTTMMDTSLTAESLSGKHMAVVSDNSNQMVRSDDVKTTSVALHVPGAYTWDIDWSKYEDYESRFGKDPLGRLDTTQGNWVMNGKDNLMKAAPVALFSGVQNNEKGDSSNRLYAADILTKFDGSAISLTGNALIGKETTDAGYVGTILYATKSDGKNWLNDAEMNATKIEQLQYYSSLAKIPKGDICVAYLTEYRPKNNNPANIKKYQQGSRIQSQVEGNVRNDNALVGNVYQCVIGGKLWHKAEYEAANGAIPSMLSNHPSKPIRLPNAWRTNYQKYQKTQYDENGCIKSETKNYHNGDSLRVLATQANITQCIEQKEDGLDKKIYHVDNNERYVHYALSPNLSKMPDNAQTTTTVTISDVLDKNMHYVPNSAYLGGTYQDSSAVTAKASIHGGVQMEPVVSVDAQKRTIVTWKLVNVQTSKPLPVLHFTAFIGTPGDEEHDVHNNDLLLTTARIKSTGDVRDYESTTGNAMTQTIQVSKQHNSALYIASSQMFYDPKDCVHYTMRAGNNSAISMQNCILMDTLPSNKDIKGSHFFGDLVVKAIQVATTALTNAKDWKCYYTKDPDASDKTSKDIKDLTIHNGLIESNNGTIQWMGATMAKDGSIPSLANQKPTAIIWVGTLKANDTFTIHMDYETPDAKSKDVLANAFSNGGDASIVKTYDTNRSVSGVAWLDANQDGQREEEEDPVAGLQVTLLKKNQQGVYVPLLDNKGNTIHIETAKKAESKTYMLNDTNNVLENVVLPVMAYMGNDGSYAFTGIPSGAYGVRFASGHEAIAKYVASKQHVGDSSSDSDGIAYYDEANTATPANKALTSVDIHDIWMPEAAKLYTSNDASLYQDVGVSYRPGSILIKQISNDGSPLAGASFMLEHKVDDGTWETIEKKKTTDEKGEVSYGDLPPGSYQLTQMHAAENTSLLKKPLQITIPFEQNQAIISNPPSYVENGKAYYLDVTYTIQAGQVLHAPMSGGNGKGRLYRMIGASLLIIAGGYFLIVSRKKQRVKRLWAHLFT